MVIDSHSAEGGLEKFLHEVDALALRLDALFSDCDRADWAAMSDEALLRHFSQIRHAMIDWFVPGAVCEPVGIQGEHLVSQLLKGSEHPQKYLSILTTTTRKSFSRREGEEMLALAQQSLQGDDVTSALRAHAQRWFWLHNNYFKTEVLGEAEFKADLELTISKHPHPDKTLSEMRLVAAQVAGEKERLIEKLKLTAAQRRLVEVLDAHAWYQDYRKEYVMRLLHYVDVALSEIGRRKRTSLPEMKWLLSTEIIPFFNGEIGNDIIVARQQYAFFVWENDQFHSYAGEAARQKEKELLKHVVSATEIIEIPGNVANPGIVRGHARVTMDPKEAKEIQKGEILVTSMTSPDFIVAIKKAAAIVTNEGGILCHAAIVSREFGIPCLVGTGIATQAIKTGDLLEVDANHGFVRILK
jgi:phosphohistidine swiveling domain-containing protein